VYILSDWDYCRNLKRFRVQVHKYFLAEFVAHLHAQSFFSETARTVTLAEWDITPQVIEFWAKIRTWIRQNPERSAEAYLFQVIDEIDAHHREHPTSIVEFRAAARDLYDAIGLRVALTRTMETPVEYV
jgi:hypothetical protein